MVAKSMDGVVTAVMKRMTSAEPFQAEPDAARRAVPGDGVHHVFRAGGTETAGGWQPWRNGHLVKTQNAEYDHARHRSINLSNWRVRSAMGASAAARRGLRTISRVGSICSRRTRSCSRMRRRIRLRTTALPMARGIVNPILGPPSRIAAVPETAECRSRKATKYGHEKRLPLSYTFLKSTDFSSRLFLENRCSPLFVGVGGTDGAFVTDRQLPTATGPAAGQDGAAILGRHTCAKTVGLGAVTVIWLKCTLRHYFFLF